MPKAKREKALDGSGAASSMIEQLTREMKAAAKLLEFEHAAYLRDKIKSSARRQNNASGRNDMTCKIIFL